MTTPRPLIVSTNTGLEYDRARFKTDAHDAIEPVRVFRPERSPSGFSALVSRERYREANVSGISTHVVAHIVDARLSMEGIVAGIAMDPSVGQIGRNVIMPARSPSRWVNVPTSRVLQVHLEPAAIAQWTEDGRERELRIERLTEDRLLDRLMEQVLAGLELPDRLHLEGLALQIASRLLSHHSVDGRAAPIQKGGLAPWQVRRVQEYLAENLASDVGIEELSNLARLSSFHFARAFKASVGLPPHAYQRQLRMERARQLLADPMLSITDVALSVGFESPQAFARTFRREMGVAPGEYRRKRLS